MIEETGNDPTEEGLTTDQLITHIQHAKDFDEVRIALGKLASKIPKLLLQKRTEQQPFVTAQVPVNEIPEHEYDRAERVFRERFGFGEKGLLSNAFPDGDLLTNAFGQPFGPAFKKQDPKKDSEFQIVYGAITHFGKRNLTDEEITKMYQDIASALGQKPQTEVGEFVEIFKNGGQLLSAPDTKTEPRELVEKELITDTAPVQVVRQSELPENPDVPVVPITDKSTAHILAYETELARLTKALDDEQTAAAMDSGGWNLVQDARDKLNAHKAVSPEEWARAQGIPIDDVTAVMSGDVDNGDGNKETDQIESPPQPTQPRQYRAKDRSADIRDEARGMSKHKRKPKVEKIEVHERGYDSLEITRRTLDDLLDAEANYNEFKKSPIHAEDPRRQSVYGPSVAERKRKYAKQLDTTIENHRSSLLTSFVEIDQGMGDRKWSNDEEELTYLTNQGKKTELFQEKLRKDKFEKLSPEEKVAVLKQFDELLKERVKILGIRTTKEIEFEEEQNQQKRKETEKLKMVSRIKRSKQAKGEEKVAEPEPEPVEDTQARSPENTDSGSVKLKSIVEVPTDVKEASGKNISGKVATEVDRFLVASEKDRGVLQFVEDGQVVYHFVRIRRPNARGEGEFELRYFELYEDGELNIDPKNKNPLNEAGVEGAFLRVYSYFLNKQEGGEIEALSFVDLGEDFVKRLAELNNVLVERNRQRLREKKEQENPANKSSSDNKDS